MLDVWEAGEAVPLFVCVGTSEHKVKSIKNSSYLQRVNREILPAIGSSVVIYGWGIEEVGFFDSANLGCWHNPIV